MPSRQNLCLKRHDHMWMTSVECIQNHLETKHAENFNRFMGDVGIGLDQNGL